jgi:hypothetical protein
VRLCADAEVAERQTRRSQKPLGFTAHVGSSPTFGTFFALPLMLAALLWGVVQW